MSRLYRPRGMSELQLLIWLKDERMEKVEAPKRIRDKGLGKCWIFTGALDNNRYGMTWCNNELIRVHRLSLQIHMKSKGMKLRKDMFAKHICKTRACFNPKHLKVGDNKKYLKLQNKLTESQVLEIRELYKTEEWTRKELSETFGVCVSNITHIINRRLWKHI